MKSLHLKEYLLLVILCLSFNRSFSQKSDVGNWFAYYGNQAIAKKWNWWNEIQYRNYNFIGDLQQLLVRTGIGYNLTENNNNVLLGYAFINSQNYLPDSDEKAGTNEHRLYQQFITRQNFGRVFIQHRYRIEERFLPDNFQMRYRYFVMLNIPINNSTMAKKTVYASAYNEIFLNGKKPVFDRDRLYGALGYVINNDLKMELGFMTQIQESTSRGQFQIGFFNNLALYKNKN
ncbi:DUF2490 domain-containing protein [Flavihumibacter fluvii]|uniref:DUF2490 domain-containing protein n=1 Tax=Flavihumibacter fluvii TaxID=2838157 RepID=UPI001BDEF112|nr:DUF2490 domain-containing protein [Flavihumibacter fluvii]ULQ50910.1 DUF2490 domain-containing protein [Flavihumibacter fluvii]